VIRWQDAKTILSYVEGTLHYGLEYLSTDEFKLAGFTDSDKVGCMEEEILHLDTCFTLVHWLFLRAVKCSLLFHFHPQKPNV
jgi:hypothetical protein